MTASSAPPFPSKLRIYCLTKLISFGITPYILKLQSLIFAFKSSRLQSKYLAHPAPATIQCSLIKSHHSLSANHQGSICSGRWCLWAVPSSKPLNSSIKEWWSDDIVGMTSTQQTTCNRVKAKLPKLLSSLDLNDRSPFLRFHHVNCPLHI